MKRRLLPLKLLAASGCGLFGEPDRSIVVDGVVVEAGTEEPLERIAVQLDRAAFSGPIRQRLAANTTGADGRFLVQRGYNIDGDYRIFAADQRLFENSPGYYRTVGENTFYVQPGDRKTLRIEMEWTER